MAAKKKPTAVGDPKAAAVWMHVTDLVPWIRNDKIRINDAKVGAMVTLLENNGFWDPIIAWQDAPETTYDDGARQAAGMRVCSGHLRMKATLRLLRDRPEYAFPGAPGPGFVPVRFGAFDGERHFEEQAAAENFHLGEWNPEGRNEWLSSLMSQGVDVAGIGVGEDILAELMRGGEDVHLGDGDGDGDGDDDRDDEGEERDVAKASSHAETGGERADVTVVLGVVRFVVSRDQYDHWYEAVRQRAGFERADIEMEIRRRLEL